MAGLIIVDRSDGRAVAGLLTSLLANWERIPVSVQAAIIRHATETAFESAGRADGNYVVTAFILKHRAAMVREARWQKRQPRPRNTGLAARAREAVETIAARRRLAVKAAARFIRIDLASMRPNRPRAGAVRWWAALVPRWPTRRRAA